MPCRYDYTPGEAYRDGYREGSKNRRPDRPLTDDEILAYSTVGKKLDKVTRLLCYVMSYGVADALVGEYGAELKRWWEIHQRKDAERKAAGEE